MFTAWSQHISVGIATGYGEDGQGLIPERGKIFLFSIESSPALGPTQPTVQWVQWDISPGVKTPGREADHSSPSSAKVKNCEVIPPFPSHVFMVSCLINSVQRHT
jgi:hypothetical protein